MRCHEARVEKDFKTPGAILCVDGSWEATYDEARTPPSVSVRTRVSGLGESRRQRQPKCSVLRRDAVKMREGRRYVESCLLTNWAMEKKDKAQCVEGHWWDQRKALGRLVFLGAYC